MEIRQDSFTRPAAAFDQPGPPKADRKRTLVACNRCRRRRQKCDGRNPSCSACLKSNSRAYPRGYVAALEARVAQLEESLYTFRPDLAQDHLLGFSQSVNEGHTDIAGLGMAGGDQNGLPTGTTDESMHSSIIEDPHTQREPLSHAESDANDSLAASIGLLALSASDEPRFLGSSSGYSFAKVLATTFNAELPTLKQRALFSSGPYSSMSSERVRFDDIEPAPIPPPSLADRLTKTYFGHMSWQYPLLSPITFSSYVSNVLQARSAASSVELYFVNMVWAIGARLSESTHGYSERYAAKAFYKTALEHCDSVFSLNDIRSVQALFLMAMYALQNHAGTSLWRLVGLAMSVAVEQGLHRDLDERLLKKKTPAEIELRSRIFWSIYALDRSDALFLGRPHRLSDEDIDIKLPRNVVELADGSLRDAESPTGLTMVIHLFRIRRIQSRITKFCCAIKRENTTARTFQKKQLRAELDAWLQTRPRLSEGHGLLGSPTEYHDLLYYNSLFILHRAALFQSEIREGDTDMIICCDAASNIIGHFILMQKRNDLQYTYYTMHHCFGAGITLLFCIWATHPASLEVLNDLSARVRNCSSLLSVIGQVFPQARPFRDTFETLATAVLSQVSMKYAARTPLSHLDPADPYGLNGSMPAVVGSDTDLVYIDMINEILGQSSRSYQQSDPNHRYEIYPQQSFQE